MMLHWYTNDNNCALTLIEKKIRFKIYGEVPNPDDCFMHNLIAPVYDFKKNNHDLSTLIYIVTISLWMLSVYKLYNNWCNGKLSSLEDIINIKHFIIHTILLRHCLIQNNIRLFYLCYFPQFQFYPLFQF